MEENICEKIYGELKKQGIKPTDGQRIVLMNGGPPRQFCARYKFGTSEFFIEEINPGTSFSVVVLEKNDCGNIDVVCSGGIKLREPCKV